MSPIREHSDPARLSRQATKQAPPLGYSQPPVQRPPERVAFDRAPLTGWLTIAALLGILGIVIYLLFFRSVPSERLRSELRLRSDPEAVPQLTVPSEGLTLDERTDLRPKKPASGGIAAAGSLSSDQSGKGPEVAKRVGPVAEVGKAITPSAQTPNRPSTSPGELADLVFQGDKALGIGDIAVARDYYEAAYDAGSSEAATRLGRTYDPLFLEERATLGLQPDPSVAMDWYRRGDKAGDPYARDRLDALLFWLHERSRAKELEAPRSSSSPR